MILAFPTLEFGGQEYEDPKEVKKFAEKHGPPGMVVLMPDTLVTRPGWWLESKPGWNFQGKWVVDQQGERHLVKKPEEELPMYFGELAEGATAEAAGDQVEEAPAEECST